MASIIHNYVLAKEINMEEKETKAEIALERDIYKRFLEIIEGELVHDYNPLASKIRGIIQRCKNTIEIERGRNDK